MRLHCVILCVLLLFAHLAASWPPRRDMRRNLNSGFPRHGQQWGKDKLRQLDNGQPMCEPIKVDICRGIGYNMTDISLSIMNKLSQTEAETELKKFQPLLLMNCSGEFLRLFLCSLYTPICMPTYGKFVPPCRFVCEKARDGCQDILTKYNVKWPEMLQCERFPEFSPSNQVCMHFNLTENKIRKKNHVSTTKIITRTTPTSMQPTFAHTTSVVPSAVFGVKVCKCECTTPMVQIIEQDPMYDKIHTGEIWNCAMPCHSPYFSQSKRDLAQQWISIWSLVCFLTTFFTTCTFLIDIGRMSYPERPIVFMAICCFMVSVGFIVRIASGHESTACNGNHIIYRSVGQMVCSIVFILIYFFSMAAMLWWVILTFTWFLAVGMKWEKDALTSYSQYYHVIAWLIPAIQTVTVLSLSAVDGDSLSGICLVGNQNAISLRAFIIAPMFVYLTLGGIFLTMGIFYAFRIKNLIKQDGEKTHKMDKLSIRIGVFSLLYMVPSVTLLTCYIYEYINKGNWDKLTTCTMHTVYAAGLGHGNSKGFAKQESDSFYDEFESCRQTPPNFIIFMVRYMSMLLVGITNAVWIFSRNTIEAWNKFCKLCLGRCFHVYNKTSKMEDKEARDNSICKIRDQNTKEQTFLMTGMCQENKRNSRSDTCLLTQCYHHPDTNIQSYSAPNVILLPASNRNLITPISQLQTSHESFKTFESTCSHNLATYPNSSSPTTYSKQCLKNTHPICCLHECAAESTCQKCVTHHRREGCSSPNHASGKTKCRRYRKDFYTSPVRYHSRVAKYESKRPRLPEMRSKSVDLYRKGCCYCHDHRKQHSNFKDEIIFELPTRLANSLPRTAARPKSPDARVCRTDQLHRKFR